MAGKKKPFYANTVAKSGSSPRAANVGPRSVLIDSLIGDVGMPIATAIAAGITGNKKLKEKAKTNAKEKPKKIKKDAEQRTLTTELKKIQSSQASKYSTAKKKIGGSVASKKKKVSAKKKPQSGHNRLY